MSSQNRPYYFLLILPALLWFIYWFVTEYMTHDLVWDELVSLTNFIFTDVKTTVTHYPDVNNHIFFSLLYNLYAKMLGITDIYQAMDHTAAMRMLTFSFGLIAVVYTYLTGARFFSKPVGALASIILVTTIPYLNFAIQLRGYTLSSTLLIMVIYHLWSFMEEGKKVHGVLTCILTAALLYSIPSNVYYALCIGLMTAVMWYAGTRKKLKDARHDKKRKHESALAVWALSNRKFHAAALLVIGAGIAFLAYQPVLHDILNERHLQQMKGQSHYMYNLTEVLPKVFLHMMSFRFLLLIPVIPGLFALYKAFRAKEASDQNAWKGLFLLGLAFLPFMLSLVRGDRPPERTFVPLASVISLILAYLLSLGVSGLKVSSRKFYLVFGLVAVYCIGTFFYARQHINTHLKKAINDGEMVFNSFYNFYQSDDYGYKYLDPLVQAAKSTGLPIVMAREIDRVAEGEYLHKHGLKYYSTVWAKKAPDNSELGYQYQVLLEISNGKGQKPGYSRIGFPGNLPEDAGKLVPIFYFLSQNKLINQENPVFYVLTFAPRWFERNLAQNLPQLKAERLVPETNYHNIYKVSKK